MYLALSVLSEEHPPTPREVETKLVEIRIAAKTLTAHLSSLRGLALQALNLGIAQAEKSAPERILTVGEVQAALISLQLAVKNARIPSGAKSSRGRAQKTLQLQIAKAAARDLVTSVNVV